MAPEAEPCLVASDGRSVVERAMFLALRPGARPMEGRHAPPVGAAPATAAG
jgi:hypothetical protein